MRGEMGRMFMFILLIAGDRANSLTTSLAREQL